MSGIASISSKRGFTLMELLAVIGIMVLLGTVSVSGYFAAVHGMEVRGAREVVATVVNNTKQRAAMDHMQTAVYFYNQLIQEGNLQHNAEVVGVAVAVRACGRVSGVLTKGEMYLLDEFADLEHSYNVVSNGMNASSKANTKNSADTMRLWKINPASAKVTYDVAYNYVTERFGTIDYEKETCAAYNITTNIHSYAYVIKESGTNGKQWKPGDCYAMEIQTIQLPKGFIFGTQMPTSLNNPIKNEPVPAIFFDSNGKVHSGSKQVQISQVKNTGSANGQLTVVSTFKSEDMTDD